MATTQLTDSARAYAVLWAATVGAACLAATLPATGRALVPLALAPHHLRSAPIDVARLAAHNLLVASLPLWLIAIGAHRRATTKRIADTAIATTLAINAGLVGIAIGAYGDRVAAYLPHLPLEWGVLAATSGSWLTARRTDDPNVVAAAALAAALAIAAATVELHLTPHA